MKMNKMMVAVLGSCMMACLATGAQAAEKMKIAMVVKNLGNGFFDAAHEGANEAAKQLGDVDIIYTGPTTATAEGQIEIISSLISQKVKAIVISANDANALVPITKKAMQRGIKVISFDSGIAKDGRLLQLNPSSPALIGQKQIEMALTFWLISELMISIWPSAVAVVGPV